MLLVDGALEEGDFLLVASVEFIDCFAELTLVCLKLFDSGLEWILAVCLILHLFKFDGYYMNVKSYDRRTKPVETRLYLMRMERLIDSRCNEKYGKGNQDSSCFRK